MSVASRLIRVQQVASMRPVPRAIPSETRLKTPADVIELLREQVAQVRCESRGGTVEQARTVGDLLTVVGRSQIGRIRYTGADELPNADVPFQSVDEILLDGQGGKLYAYLIDKFAEYSGISGVQPKVMVRDAGASKTLSGGGDRQSPSIQGATHIVKFWEANEFPQLAANEFFCLRAAQICGLDVPGFQLSDDGLALVIERFDLRPDGTYCGFEDFCVLNALPVSDKYRGSYESAVIKRFKQFAASPELFTDLEKLFTLIVLNCALRNGDAHLKNFGIVYGSVLGEARLAPVYDLVTTTAYLPPDHLALSLNGSKEWPDAKALTKLGRLSIGMTPAKVKQTFERVGDALSKAGAELHEYARDHAEFAEIGARMLEQWEVGRKHSLQGASLA